MQPLNYLQTPMGLVWIIMCVPLGFVLTALGYLVINKIPAKWLCDYNEVPSQELLTGKRISFFPTGIPASAVMALGLVLCRLQFNKRYDIYFALLALILFVCLMIAAADIKYQIIPDQFTIALGIFALMLSVYDLVRGYNILHCAWWSPLAGAGIGAAAMMLIDFIGMIAYKRDGMGFGDVKLFLAVGILTGFPGTIYAFLISIVTATFFFVAIIIISKIRYGNASDQENEAAKTETDAEAEEEPIYANETDMIGTESSEENSGSEAGESPADDKTVGFGSYLAFGPYIAAATAAYVVLFDFIKYLAQLYLDLF